jgi:hypothetical protein
VNLELEMKKGMSLEFEIEEGVSAWSLRAFIVNMKVCE